MSLLYEGAPVVVHNAWNHSIEGGAILAYTGWVYPHLADGVLIYQTETTTTVH